MPDKKDYAGRYAAYLAEIPVKTASGRQRRQPLLGFCSDLDVVLLWDISKYNRLLAQYLHAQPEQGLGKPIASMKDFAKVTSWYISRGLGGCAEIINVEVCTCLQELFSSEEALGGTCVQAAAALGAMGFSTDAHLTDKSMAVCRLLKDTGVMTIENCTRIPAEKLSCSKEPIYHIILQYQKDDELIIGDERVRIPCSNRLIFLYDSVHKHFPVSEDFLHYYEQAAASPSVYLLSGFDAILDMTVLQDRLDMLTAHLKVMRQNHPTTVFYLEEAFYLNPEIRQCLLHRLSPMVDIVGMNEEELADQIQEQGITIDLTDARQVLTALDKMRSVYGMRGIVLHTKDYALYYGKNIPGCDPEKGLAIGNLMAATRARLGKYGTINECKDTLSLPVSKAGTAFAEKMLDLAMISKEDRLYIVPSLYMEHPRYTIGLGDTFTAGVLSCFS